MKRRIGAILGTLVIATIIIISGSAVAGWYYVVSVDYEQDCTDSEEALDAPDGVHATIGRASGTPSLGEIILDFGVNSGMLGGQNFTVYASSTVRENYSLRLLEHPGRAPSTWWTGLDDTTDQNLIAPSIGPTKTWRFVEIHSEEGDSESDPDDDPIYGSEIDAVGYYQW